MPTIRTTKDGGVIRWDKDDWLAGLVPQYISSNASDILGVRGLASARAIDVFRKPGYILPGFNPVDVTNVSVVDALLINGVANGSTAYIMSNGTKFHSMDITNSTLTSPALRTISAHGGHTTVKGGDVIVYRISGTKYLFYSWNDNTDGDVGRFDLSATYDDDYMSTVPTGMAALARAPHPMIEGDDGILYIANGNNLASFNGTTFSSSALDLPPGYIITSFAKTKNFLVLYAYQSFDSDPLSVSTFYRSNATAFYWDYVSASYTYAEPLQGNYVNGGFIYGDTIGCFVQGRSADIYGNRLSRLLLREGGGFKTKWEFFDNIPGHGGVNVEGDVIYWNSGGVIWQYGAPYIGFDKIANKLMEGSGSSNEGMLRNFSGSTLYGSSGTTTSGGLQSFNTDYYFQSSYSVPIVSPPFGEFHKGRITSVKAYWGAAASGGNNFSLTLRTNRAATNTTILSNHNTVTNPNLVTRYDLDTSGAPLPMFESVGWSGVYSTGSGNTNAPPYLEALEIYYENANI